MVKCKIWLFVVPQIAKDLMNSLYNCKATFEINVSKSSFVIKDVVGFNLDDDKTEAMYCIRINTENNTKDVFVAKDNVKEFTVHINA